MMSTTRSVNVFDKGVAKFSVPSGHYWAVGMFAQTEGTRYVGERIVVLPQFTVRGSTSVSMAERAASSRNPHGDPTAVAGQLHPVHAAQIRRIRPGSPVRLGGLAVAAGLGEPD